MNPRVLIVIGASAGGVEALRGLVSGLRTDMTAAVCVVLHTPAEGGSNLPTILERSGPLPAAHAVDGAALEAATIYVAPPDRHLTVLGGHLRVSRGPRENGSRPAVDPLFRSAATTFGSCAIGVILSGTLADGASGLRAIKQAGGTVLTQDPDEALFPGMPRSAAELVAIDHVAAANELGGLISSIAATLNGGTSMSLRRPSPESHGDEQAATASVDPHRDPPGAPSHFSCPDCGGVLWRAESPLDADFRCRVGHAYSVGALDRAQEEHVEDALWIALRALEESAVMSRKLATDADAAGRSSAYRRFDARVAQAEERAAIVRRALANRGEQATT